MPVFGESQHSTHEVEISNTCCLASSISNKQQGKHFSLSDVSSESQSTVITEATSIDSSFHSGPVEEIPSRLSSPSASINRYNINGSKKKNNTSSYLPKETRISFSVEVLQQTTMGRHAFSEDELKACWLSGDEYAEITKSCLNQILKLEKGTKLRDQGYSVRGLESHTRLAGLAKSQTKRDAWDAVLFEQEEQIPLGVIDEETIALRYQDVSSSCQFWAYKVALDDQKAAQLVYDEDTLDEV